MKIPVRPPPLRELLRTVSQAAADRLPAILSLQIPPDDARGKYSHWDKLRHEQPPPGDLTHEEWWLGIKTARRSIYEQLPHTAVDGSPFLLAEPKAVRRLLHQIDKRGAGELKSAAPIANQRTRNLYLVNSLIEEAITSSQLEGAATTRKVAKEMLRQKRKPTNQSERMIFNNYRAMEFIKDRGETPLSSDLILELHGIVTDGTLRDRSQEGKYRSHDDVIVDDARDYTTLFVPPPHVEIADRIERICEFANDASDEPFLHPVVRAVLLHLLLAYVHPFEDGNGRTARALFYWSMLRQQYWTMEYVSISRILKQAPAQYMRSYLYTETDENDVTYFVIYQLQVILRAIEDLLEYLASKSRDMEKLRELVSGSEALRDALNHRQLQVVQEAVKSPHSELTIQAHKSLHRITYDTARTDLLKLEDLGLLEKRKAGRAFVFSPAQDLESRLRDYRDRGAQ